jgi:hypothetical protein
LPIDVTFNGPRDTPVLNGPGSGNTIQVNRNITSGHWVRVRTVDPTTGQLSAVDDTGADAFADIDVDTAMFVGVGTSSWSATSASGSGAVNVAQRDAYA